MSLKVHLINQVLVFIVVQITHERWISDDKMGLKTASKKQFDYIMLYILYAY